MHIRMLKRGNPRTRPIEIPHWLVIERGLHYGPTPLERVHGRLPPLEVGDIILIRHRKGAIRRLLHLVTESHWDHAALVLFHKDPERGYDGTIIIESIQYGLMSSLRNGTSIHRLEKYLTRPDLFDIGIKRVPRLTVEYRERVRSFMLMNVDTQYYPISTSGLLLAWIFPAYKRFWLSRQRFSCSGLVQKAFYESLHWEDRHRVLFTPHGYTPIDAQDRVSPADIAVSRACEWIWNAH